MSLWGVFRYHLTIVKTLQPDVNTAKKAVTRLRPVNAEGRPCRPCRPCRPYDLRRASRRQCLDRLARSWVLEANSSTEKPALTRSFLNFGAGSESQ